MVKKQSWNESHQKDNNVKTGLEIPEPGQDTSPWHEERFRAFFNSIKDAVFVHPFREEGFATFIEVNDTACERYGYTREELLKLKATDITVPADVQQHAKADSRKKLLLNRRAVFETIHIKKSGETFPVEINSNIIEQNDEVLILAVIRDITERKLAEEALRESEERYRSMFQDSHAVMLIIDPDNFDIVDANPAAVSFYGYSIEEIRKMNISDINMLSGEEVSRIVKKIKKDRQSHLYLRHRLANGEIKDVEVYSGPVKMQGKVLLFSIVHDITEHKRAEDEKSKLETRLHHAEKMEAIGTLAGGVAHEFNNILGIIMGNTELAMGEVSESNPASDFLKEINRASLRAKDIVKNILNFARKSLTERTLIKISDITKESIGLIRSTTPAMIEIRHNIECDDETILGDATEMSQVLINLCNNAIQAIGNETGVLEVSLKLITLDRKSIAGYEDLKPGKYVRLTVKDSGCGIDPQIMGRIFDPYFTTSSLAERTGMGLSITHGIVKKHEGAISVESDWGKGAVFEVLFPVKSEKNMQHDMSETTESASDDRRRILFVDDEVALIKIWKQMLQNWGYEVETSVDSLKALELFKSDPFRFDLVITDIGMPHMSGDRLAEELLKIRNSINIIICTGYSERIDEEKAEALGVSHFITKPINVDEFKGSIEEILG
ncbi:MAG: PAS domain S-box protein [Desulfobacteraceae bacterium]